MAKRKVKRRKEPPREIGIIGELFEEGEIDVVKALLEVPPGDEVVLYIDSPGGSVYAALAICSILRLRELKSTAVVVGECSSAALLVFAACQRRLVTPRSTFLFHRVKWRSERDVRCDEAGNWAQHFRWLETEVDRYQAEMFKLTPDRLSEWIDKGKFVIGPELVELGIAELVEV